MTLDKARTVLETFSIGKVPGEVRVLDVEPGSHPSYYNILRRLTWPGADPGLMTEREVEALRVYVGQWSDEEADALITVAYLEMAQKVRHVE